jgi:hypothetical protein
MNVFFFVFLFFIFISNAFTQNTQEKGTVFFGIGIGKSLSFSPTFNLNKTNKQKSSLIDDWKAPQWSANIGYLFENHFALNLSVERFLWNYNSNLALNNDLLYTRLGVLGMDKIFKTNKSNFALTWLTGISGGPVFSNNRLSNPSITLEKNSFNGFGITTLASLRFEFQKRVYFLFEQMGGFIYQSVKGNNINIELSQFYIRSNLSFGIFIYERWNESCNTCPKW